MIYGLPVNTPHPYYLLMILTCFAVDLMLKTLENNINNELSQIYVWLKVNKLSLNIKETHHIVFTKRKLKLQIDGEAVKEVHKTKFLGVIIDNKLTWVGHISYICGKISRGIGVIIRTRHLMKIASWLYITYLYIHILCIAIIFGVLHIKPI